MVCSIFLYSMMTKYWFNISCFLCSRIGIIISVLCFQAILSLDESKQSNIQLVFGAGLVCGRVLSPPVHFSPSFYFCSNKSSSHFQQASGGTLNRTQGGWKELWASALLKAHFFATTGMILFWNFIERSFWNVKYTLKNIIGGFCSEEEGNYLKMSVLFWCALLPLLRQIGNKLTIILWK